MMGELDSQFCNRLLQDQEGTGMVGEGELSAQPCFFNSHYPTCRISRDFILAGGKALCKMSSSITPR